ncbi:phage holin family protein [Mesorhizobium sp. NZP2298]|uniref:phage holin family protein n=1 Tax=Mesorhizobium sp. NZP2298 TaxID=2483403 RepID=UPI001554784C|nr:phage holin family protein [Mesorhizobium sp. NZP2298]QKC98294.1 phage holin family protein [Mesorhizobium sp. NZP2298]
MDDGAHHRPFGSVLNDAIGQFASLMRLDLRLLEAEMRAKATPIVSSGACGVAAALFFVLAAFALVEFLILAMIHFGVDAMFACLTAGAVLVGAGMLSLYLAKRALIGWTIAPVETVNQVRADLAALKQGIRYGSTQQ